MPPGGTYCTRLDGLPVASGCSTVCLLSTGVYIVCLPFCLSRHQPPVTASRNLALLAFTHEGQIRAWDSTDPAGPRGPIRTPKDRLIDEDHGFPSRSSPPAGPDSRARPDQHFQIAVECLQFSQAGSRPDSARPGTIQPPHVFTHDSRSCIKLYRPCLLYTETNLHKARYPIVRALITLRSTKHSDSEPRATHPTNDSRAFGRTAPSKPTSQQAL